MFFGEPVQLIVAVPSEKEHHSRARNSGGASARKRPPAPSMMYIPGAKVNVPLPPREIEGVSSWSKVWTRRGGSLLRRSSLRNTGVGQGREWI